MSANRAAGSGLALAVLLACTACASPRSPAAAPVRVALFAAPRAPPIVNGVPAPRDFLPWQVSLQSTHHADPLDAHFCGGAIYSAQWIITAAHCVNGLGLSTIRVLAGRVELEPGGRLLEVVERKVYVPAGYSSLNGDIALLKLARPLRFDRSVQPIPLLTPDEEVQLLAASPVLTVSGWGAEAEGGRPVRRLMMAEVSYIGPERCNSAGSYDGSISEKMLCAGHDHALRDACQWDSGGPLVVGAGGAPGAARLVGVVSQGTGCARPEKYGIYTRISRFAKWIRDNAI
jgi:secreted trypsin-like serine protease